MLRMTNFQPNKVVNSIFNFRLYLNSHLYFYIFHIFIFEPLYKFRIPQGTTRLRAAILSTYAGVVQHIRKCKYTHEEKTISSANI